MLTRFSQQLFIIPFRNAVFFIAAFFIILSAFLKWDPPSSGITALMLAVTCFSLIKFVENLKSIHTSKYMQNFTHIPEAELFEETLPLFSTSGKKLPHIVLLIHGFSASTSEFRYLTPELKNRGIPYYAPLLTGFGLDNVKRLKKINISDWLRDVLSAYQVASQMADKVSVIAHSMGVMLAFYLIAKRPVHRIIFTSPYFNVKENHKLLKRIMLTPVLSHLLCMVNPTVKKNDRKDVQKLKNSGRFVYTSVPTKSIKTLWHLQEFAAPYFPENKRILLLLGSNDGTINIPEVISSLSGSNACETIQYPKSGHNILEEEERQQVVDKIIMELERQ